MDKSTLIYNTLEGLSNAEPQEFAQIRQDLYNRLGLTFEQQTALYTSVLGPAGAGKITDINNAVESAWQILGE